MKIARPYVYLHRVPGAAIAFSQTGVVSSGSINYSQLGQFAAKIVCACARARTRNVSTSLEYSYSEMCVLSCYNIIYIFFVVSRIPTLYIKIICCIIMAYISCVQYEFINQQSECRFHTDESFLGEAAANIHPQEHRSPPNLQH